MCDLKAISLEHLNIVTVFSSFSSHVFEEIIPELVALLPDVGRQQALLEVDERKTPTDKKGRTGGWAADGAGARRTRDLRVCPLCTQVLREWDAAEHADTHLQNPDFPALG